MEKLFVIGDVHGCYYTLLRLLEQWDEETELLAFVGDFVDRGEYIPEVVEHVKNLVAIGKAVAVQGNHEALLLEYLATREGRYMEFYGHVTLPQYEKSTYSLEEHTAWMASLPLSWENDAIFISHAGIGQGVDNPLEPPLRKSIQWFRGPKKNIGKLQILGHTPLEEIELDEENRSLNIDTGAVYGRKLTGVKLAADGTILQFLNVPVVEGDVLLENVND